MQWLDRMMGALEYLEAHLDDECDVNEAARVACSSPFHFQRMFHMLTGVTVAEYVRKRRLSLAAQDSGDGPMFFALTIIGTLAVGFASIAEVYWHPPLWLHALLWIPFTFIGCVVCMRFFKGWLIAIQFKNNPETFTGT